MRIRENRAKRMLAEGIPVLAPNLGPNSTPDADTLDLLGSTGVIDVAWIEMEHGGWDWGDLSGLSRVCDLWGMTSVVRVDSNDPGTIGRVLDRGIQGILVPHVNTRADAQAVVDAAYFAPLGRRGLFLSRQSYGVDEYFADANSEVLVGVLIEEVEALRNLDAILDVDGIDCFFVAPADLAQTMGPEYVGKPFVPEVQDLVKDTVRRIVAHGRTAGTIVDDGNLDEYLDLGARLLRIHALPMLVKALEEFRDKAHDASTTRTNRDIISE